MKIWDPIRGWYRNVETPQTILIGAIVALSLLVIVAYFLSDKILPWINALAGAGLFGIALYGLRQYKTISAEKRPYVGVMKATAESSFTTDCQVKLSEYEKNTEGYKALKKIGKEDLIGTYVSSQIIHKLPPPIPEDHEEIIITLRVKNTGPIGAVDCSIHFIEFHNYASEPPKQKYVELLEEIEELKRKGENTKRKESTLAAEIDLMPNQEQTYVLLAHSKETKDKPVFLLLKLTYFSIKDIQKQKPFTFYAVYVVSEFKAYTLVRVAQLRRTQMDE